MLVSTQFVYFQHYTKYDLMAVDPSRIAASVVVTGVGFLGGGAILRTGLNVQGLTTAAAGLWLVAAIGLSAGAGMYAICVASTVLGVVALTVLRRFEHKEDMGLGRKVTLVLDETAPPLQAIIADLDSHGISVAPTEYERGISMIGARAGNPPGKGFPRQRVRTSWPSWKLSPGFGGGPH